MLYTKTVLCALLSLFVSKMVSAFDPDDIELCSGDTHEVCYLDPESEFGVGYGVSDSKIDIIFNVPEDMGGLSNFNLDGRLNSVIMTVHMDSDKDWDYIGRLYKDNSYGEEILILTQSDSGSAYDMPQEFTFSAAEIISTIGDSGLMVFGTYRLELSTQNSDRIRADAYCLKELCFKDPTDVSRNYNGGECSAISDYAQVDDIVQECDVLSSEDDCEDNYNCEWKSYGISSRTLYGVGGRRRMAIERDGECVIDSIVVPGGPAPDCSALDESECINTSECLWVSFISRGECVVDNIIIGENTPKCDKFGKRRCLRESQCRWME